MVPQTFEQTHFQRKIPWENGERMVPAHVVVSIHELLHVGPLQPQYPHAQRRHRIHQLLQPGYTFSGQVTQSTGLQCQNGMNALIDGPRLRA